MKKFICVILTVIMLTVAASAVLGDVNSDGKVNNKDVVSLFRYVNGNKDAIKDETACDINADGKLNNKDVVYLFRSVNGIALPGSVFEEAVLYPCNEIEHVFDEDTLQRIIYMGMTAGRNVRHVCPGESFQFRLYSAMEPDIEISLKDVDLSISSGEEFCELTDNGVFKAKKEGDVTLIASLKANSGKKCGITIKIKEPDALDDIQWQGSGTFYDPFLINNVTDFLNLVEICKYENFKYDYTKGGHWFKQTADLDFDGVDYIPPEDFIYNYDGNGHKIKNVTVDGDTETSSGLFGRVRVAVIKNLTLENYTYKRNDTVSVEYVGSLASGEYSGLFYNCNAVNVDIEVMNNSRVLCVGGFVGHCSEASNFVNCSVSGSVKCDKGAGGFFGTGEGASWFSIFVNCTADVTVESTEGSSNGFCKAADKMTYFYNCQSTQKDVALDIYNR